VETLRDKVCIEKRRLLSFQIAEAQRDFPNITLPAEEQDGVPLLPEDVRFDKWTLMSKGTHAQIFLAEIAGEEGPEKYCVKLFRKDWLTPFNFELAAYGQLLKHEVALRYIPEVYGYARRTLSDWGLNAPDNPDLYYGIVIEWFDNAEKLSIWNITVPVALDLLMGLYRIHEAGVLHHDPFSRNMLVLPKANRAVWIDFSCAHLNRKALLGGEMISVMGNILHKVFTLCSKLTISLLRRENLKE